MLQSETWRRCDSSGRSYARSRSDFLQRVIVDSIESICGLTSVSRALDVGCGTGQSTVPLSRIAEQVVGLDASAEMLTHAADSGSVVYVRTLAEQLPFGDGTFDLATAGLAFHWFDREQFLDEARRVLNPSGWLVIYNNWFCGKMAENAEFEHWFCEEYLERYPSPPRNNTPLPETAFTERDFTVVERKEYEEILRMTSRESVNYLMTQTNVIAAAEEGVESVDSIAQWAHASVGCLFPDTRASFSFGGHATFLQACRR